jgi:retron-type reverse transcriptase
MSKKYRNLYPLICDWKNIRDAYHQTCNGKRKTWGYLEFKEYEEFNLRTIQQELLDKTYEIGNYRHFTIYEPKPRLISALEFKDRLVQHALCNIITPIFERTFLPSNFACRNGMGTHKGVKHVQALLRKHNYSHFLKTDYSKYFPNVDHERLYQEIEKKITCRDTLELIKKIVPPEGKGLPIGSLTSQLFANVYGNIVDQYIHHTLKHRHWARYMDDVVILGNDPIELRESFEKIQTFSKEEMGMRISKWCVRPINAGIDFLGYRIWPSHKLIRKDSATRAKRKIKKYIYRGDKEALKKFVAAWRGHIQWADCHNLKRYLRGQYEIHNQHARGLGRNSGDS